MHISNKTINLVSIFFLKKKKAETSSAFRKLQPKEYVDRKPTLAATPLVEYASMQLELNNLVKVITPSQDMHMKIVRLS
jgi:hypothetical protein